MIDETLLELINFLARDSDLPDADRTLLYCLGQGLGCHRGSPAGNAGLATPRAPLIFCFSHDQSDAHWQIGTCILDACMQTAVPSHDGSVASSECHMR